MAMMNDQLCEKKSTLGIYEAIDVLNGRIEHLRTSILSLVECIDLVLTSEVMVPGGEDKNMEPSIAKTPITSPTQGRIEVLISKIDSLAQRVNLTTNRIDL